MLIVPFSLCDIVFYVQCVKRVTALHSVVHTRLEKQQQQNNYQLRGPISNIRVLSLYPPL